MQVNNDVYFIMFLATKEGPGTANYFSQVGFVNNALLEHDAYTYLLSKAALDTQQSWGVATQIAQVPKTKLFTIWSFKETVC